ncbi:MAG: hypothetical protein Kow00105_15480 [Phycisphaeraceae bacterium]
MRVSNHLLPGLLVGLLLPAAVSASDQVFFDNGQFALRAADGGVFEPAVPIYHNGTLVGGHNHKIVEAFDNVPGTGSFPLTFVDLHANTFLRTTYQKANGQTGALGTSVVGSASFRTSAGLQFIPTVTRGDINTTGFFGRYFSQIVGNFGTQASLTTTRSYPDPVIGKTTVGLSVQFTADQNIPLVGGSFTGNDRFRMLTVSSMFADPSVFDADMLRYEDAQGNIQTLRLSSSTPRNAHLFAAPDEVGNWIELIKNPGSTWFPDSPTIRIDLTDKGGLRLGVQGFLAGTTNPNDDSLSVWLEWLDAPDTIPAGTTLGIEVDVVGEGDPDRPVITGDANADGFVGISDLNLVLGGWNQAVLPGFFTAGDLTADGFVGIDDLNQVLGNWNAGSLPPGGHDGDAVPEPGMVGTVLLGMLLAVNRRT